MPVTPSTAPDLEPVTVAQVRVVGDVLRRIDEWRRQRPRIPSRSASARMLLERALDAEERASAKLESGRAAS